MVRRRAPQSKLRPEQHLRRSNDLPSDVRTFADAVIYAAEQVGEDGLGKNGLTGYLTHLARFYPKIFVTLLARLIADPTLEIDREKAPAKSKEFKTLEEVREELRELPETILN